MNTERIQKLADALVSGEYPQTQACLKRGQEFCIWGVGCDVFRKETGIGRWEAPFKLYNGQAEYFVLNDGSKDAYGPHNVVLEWYGLDQTKAADDKVVEGLMSANDMGAPFTRLAEILVAVANGQSDALDGDFHFHEEVASVNNE